MSAAKVVHTCHAQIVHMDQSHFRILWLIIWISKLVVIILPQISCCIVVKILLCFYKHMCNQYSVYSKQSVKSGAFKNKNLVKKIKEEKNIFGYRTKHIFTRGTSDK